jgi:hypothetical protein
MKRNVKEAIMKKKQDRGREAEHGVVIAIRHKGK